MIRTTHQQHLPERFSIKPMVPGDLESVVEIHLQSFQGFFLTFLGADFLHLLYSGIMDDSAGIVLVGCTADGHIEGFVAGVTQQSGFYQRLLKRRKWAFAVTALGALIRRPAIAPRLLRSLRRSQETQQASAEACLMSIAVRPQVTGAGLGQRLVHAFCQALMDHGANTVCLTTDRDNNERVNCFYRQLGFRLSREYTTPEGRAMNEYVIADIRKGLE